MNVDSLNSTAPDRRVWDLVVPSPHPTIRSIAAALGLSRSTVSNALRGLEGVNADTRRQVELAAQELGYSTHPFAAQVMSQLRRKAAGKQVGTLAVLEMHEPDRPVGALHFNRDLKAGIKEQTDRMGFSLSHWNYGPGGELSLKRLNHILQWRGIQGLIFLPTWSEPDLLAIEWPHFTAIYLDYFIRHPPLHTVVSDHYRTLFTALDKAHQLGYRRPGFAVVKRANDRIHGRWIGAYLGFLHTHPEMQSVPPLLVDELRSENFRPWFREHQPDIVITHWIDAPEHMKAEGAEIPRRHGYICLNVLPATTPLSGFDVQPKLLGMRAAELVVSQLEHHDRGIPLVASSTLVPSLWVNGPTTAGRI